MSICLSPYQSPLGPITIASNGEALVGLWFDGQRYDRANIPSVTSYGSDGPIRQAQQWLDLYFSGNHPQFTPPLLIQGSEFHQHVARILLSIPYGKTTTYGSIAQIIAVQTGRQHFSAQAVGGAVGRNAISIIIPCHRVVGANGALTGYAGGIERKRALLALENISLP